MRDVLLRNSFFIFPQPRTKLQRQMIKLMLLLHRIKIDSEVSKNKQS